MKMIKCFGVEPQAVKRWEQFRYVMEKFGYSQGRVIAKLPKRWISELLDCLDDVGDIERQRFIEKLRRYKEDRFLSVGDSGDGSWIERARRLRSQGIIDEILVSTQSAQNHSGFIEATPDIVDDDFFQVPREIRCEASLDNLVDAAKAFLFHSSEVTLVDPYFNPCKPGNKKVLEAFFDVACSNKRCKQITVITDEEMKPKNGEYYLDKYSEQVISNIASAGFSFRMAFIDKQAPDITLHARYLIGSQGGLRYDKGFCVSSDLTDICILDDPLFSELRNWVEQLLVNEKTTEVWEWRKS